tara:strand:+ start:10669 stop:11127 length:459 start_codon:yes stop_codon:yes gene_type:complete
MPLFDYQCKYGHVTERLIYGGDIPNNAICKCGSNSERMVSAPAYTPGRWGDQTGKYGVNGHYDHALGASYSTSMEKEAIMRKKGVISSSDLDQHFVEDRIQKEEAEHAQHQGNIKALKQNLAKHEPGRAIAETFSVPEMRKQGILTDSNVKG